MNVLFTRKRGLSLVELLVVLGIIGVLVALLLPAIQQSREAARRTECKNQLRQLGLAALNHHDVHQQFPPGWTGKSASMPHDVIGATGWGWASHLLPFLEQTAVADRLVLDWSLLHPANDVSRSQSLEIFRCPSDIEARPLVLEYQGASLYELPPANYVGNFGPGEPSHCDKLVFTGQQCRGGGVRGVFFHNSETKLADLYAGASNTVIIGERASKVDEPVARATWTGVGPGIADPFAKILGSSAYAINSDNPQVFSSRHPQGSLFVYADAHVALLNETMDPEVWKVTTSIDGTTGTDDETASGDDDDDDADDNIDATDPDFSLPPPWGSGNPGSGVCPTCGQDTKFWWMHVPGLEDHK